MKSKNLISMIIVLLMFFCGQLIAEEVVGESIFPGIETPHPYPLAAEDNTLVWSTTIHEPGAAWIKIHFSEFRLNPKDYVTLTDMNGKLVERIRGKDVAVKLRSKFNVKDSGNKTVSFWGPAVDGDMLIVELHRTSTKKQDFGFIVDEVGVGGKPLKPERRVTDSGRIGEAMLYQKGSTWYISKGSLGFIGGNRFVSREVGIDSQDIVDTLEVRFFLEYADGKNGNIVPMYYTFYGERIGHREAGDDTGHFRLRPDRDMIRLSPMRRNPGLSAPLSETCCEAVGYEVDVYDQATLNAWKTEKFEPPVTEASSQEDAVLGLEIDLPKNINNTWYWYRIILNLDIYGYLRIISQNNLFLPPFEDDWWPLCCHYKATLCFIFQKYFPWLNMYCWNCFLDCLFDWIDNPCHTCGIWGLPWLFIILGIYY